MEKETNRQNAGTLRERTRPASGQNHLNGTAHGVSRPRRTETSIDRHEVAKKKTVGRTPDGTGWFHSNHISISPSRFAFLRRRWLFKPELLLRCETRLFICGFALFH
jgi:hypothetical protein